MMSIFMVFGVVQAMKSGGVFIVSGSLGCRRGFTEGKPPSRAYYVSTSAGKSLRSSLGPPVLGKPGKHWDRGLDKENFLGFL